MRTFISYGKPTFNLKEFEPVYNHLLTKPGKGFWACDYTPDKEYYSEWERWFINEYQGQYPGESGAVTFKLKEDANIFVIKDKKDFITLMQKYPNPKIAIKRTAHSTAIPYVTGIGIDFTQMAQDFDGIELSSSVCSKEDWEDPFFVSAKALKIKPSQDQKNRWRNQFGFVELEFPKRYMKGEKPLGINIKDWAVPSICIFNPEVITEIETFEPDYRRHVADMLKQGFSEEQIKQNLLSQIKRPEFVDSIIYYSSLHPEDPILTSRYNDINRASKISSPEKSSSLPAKQNKLLYYWGKFKSMFVRKSEKTQEQPENDVSSKLSKGRKSLSLPADEKAAIQRGQVQIAKKYAELSETQKLDDWQQEPEEFQQ